MKFRKKPVVIEAVQFDGSQESLDAVFCWLDEHGEMGSAHRDAADRWVLEIETLEGTLNASPGDWIICGVKGEFYPCKPDVFAATYERAARSSGETTPAAGPVVHLGIDAEEHVALCGSSDAPLTMAPARATCPGCLRAAATGERAAAIEALRSALRRIADWKMPPAMDREGKPCSYGSAYGSNGERDFARAVARQALGEELGSLFLSQDALVSLRALAASHGEEHGAPTPGVSSIVWAGPDEHGFFRGRCGGCGGTWSHIRTELYRDHIILTHPAYCEPDPAPAQTPEPAPESGTEGNHA